MDITPYLNWFLSYTHGFAVCRDKGRKNIELKEKHSLRVYENAAAIGEAHGFYPRVHFLTRLAALFHDLGRFEQYSRYNTFKDNESVDHARLGFSILKEKGILSPLPAADRRVVLLAVLLHNKKTLPSSLGPEYSDCLRAVRDADKLDIMPVVIDHLQRREKDQAITMGLRDRPENYSPQVLRQVKDCGLVNYTDMVFINDFKLLLLSWVYGLNFAYSYAVLEKKRYLDELCALLPDAPELKGLKDEVLQFVHHQGRLGYAV